MNKLPFTEEFLLIEYKKSIDEMLDLCDWVTHISDYTICNHVAIVAIKNGFDVDTGKLLKLYKKKVDSLGLDDDAWREEYGDWKTGVPKIIAMIYDILENKYK